MLGMIFVEISVLVQINCLFKVDGVETCFENLRSFPKIYLWGNPCSVELRTVECTFTKTGLRCIYFKGTCICSKDICKINRVLAGWTSLSGIPEHLLKVSGNLNKNQPPLDLYLYILCFTCFLSSKFVLWNLKTIAWKRKFHIVQLN